jgi:UDP-glucose 4-epimerase
MPPTPFTEYRDRSILVTGGASFIGSHLCERLVAAGARVTVADDLSSGRLENLAACAGDVRFLRGDLRDANFAATASRGAEIVFHLAAVHGGRGYIETHADECARNVDLDATVFAAAIAAGCGRIVFASSACVYPPRLQDAPDYRLREADADPTAPTDDSDGLYGRAKLATERRLLALHRAHRIDAIACRIFTAYGERENESHAVPALIAKAAARLDPFPIWGDGRQTRNFTYVADTVHGLVAAGAKLHGFDAVNIGTERHHTVHELAEEIFRVLGWRPGGFAHQLDRPVGVRHRAADNTGIRARLQWEPSVSLADGLARTIRWYLKQHPAPPADLERRLLERA